MVPSYRPLNTPIWGRVPKSILLWALVAMLAQAAHARSVGAPWKPLGGDGTPYEEPEVVVGTDDSDPKDPPSPFPGSRQGGTPAMPSVGKHDLIPTEVRFALLRVVGILSLHN